MLWHRFATTSTFEASARSNRPFPSKRILIVETWWASPLAAHSDMGKYWDTTSPTEYSKTRLIFWAIKHNHTFSQSKHRLRSKSCQQFPPPSTSTYWRHFWWPWPSTQLNWPFYRSEFINHCQRDALGKVLQSSHTINSQPIQMSAGFLHPAIEKRDARSTGKYSKIAFVASSPAWGRTERSRNLFASNRGYWTLPMLAVWLSRTVYWAPIHQVPTLEESSTRAY